MNNYELLPLVTDNNTSHIETTINPINNNIPCCEINNCSICLEPLVNNIQKLSCNHILHNDCYDLLYTQDNPKCPLCNVKIVKPKTTILFNSCNFKIKINYDVDYFIYDFKKAVIILLVFTISYGLLLILFNAILSFYKPHLLQYCDNKTYNCECYYKKSIINNTEVNGFAILYSFMYDDNELCYNTTNYNLPSIKINEIAQSRINENINIFVSKENKLDCIFEYFPYKPNDTYIRLIVEYVFYSYILFACLTIMVLFYGNYLTKINNR